MSLETWKAEFYPTPANEVPAHDALAHSIQKWTGLLKKNLKKHGVRIGWKELVGPDSSLRIAAGTCALCIHHYGFPECRNCPLFQSRGGVRCDKTHDDEFFPPYKRFLDGDARPMLNALKKAQKFQARKGAQ